MEAGIHWQAFVQLRKESDLLSKTYQFNRFLVEKNQWLSGENLLNILNAMGFDATDGAVHWGKDGLGPRGGTLCFGDSDLRPIYNRPVNRLCHALIQDSTTGNWSNELVEHFNFFFCWLYQDFILVQCKGKNHAAQHSGRYICIGFCMQGNQPMNRIFMTLQGSWCTTSQLEWAWARNSDTFRYVYKQRDLPALAFPEDRCQCGPPRPSIFSGRK